MVQTDFFAESTDCDRIVRFAFGCGLTIVPDLPYQTPEVRFVSKWEEFAEVTDCRSFFLLDFDQLQSPFAFVHVANKGEYRLHQRKGGPSLSLLTCHSYERDGYGLRWIPSGMLGYYSTYHNTITLEDDPAPEYLIAVYHKLVGEIKRDARLAAGVNRRYWVMPQAYSALKSGAQLNVRGVRLREESPSQ